MANLIKNYIQQNHLYSVFFAPRGNVRMTTLGMQIAQQYMTPFDQLIGIIGEAIVPCTGPRIHVRHTGEIENFRMLKEVFYDEGEKRYVIVGLVGERWDYETEDLNRIAF